MNDEERLALRDKSWFIKGRMIGVPERYLFNRISELDIEGTDGIMSVLEEDIVKERKSITIEYPGNAMARPTQAAYAWFYYLLRGSMLSGLNPVRYYANVLAYMNEERFEDTLLEIKMGDNQIFFIAEFADGCSNNPKDYAVRSMTDRLTDVGYRITGKESGSISVVMIPKNPDREEMYRVYGADMTNRVLGYDNRTTTIRVP